MPASKDPTAPRSDGRPARSDRNHWYWLLILPIVVPLAVPLFNRTDPTLFGFPFFYWFQLALIALGVLTTTFVYRVTREG